jgi:uncharacterized membrane protein
VKKIKPGELATQQTSAVGPPVRGSADVVYAGQIKVEQHTGPIPSPSALAEYKAIDPGLVDRIVGMAEREQASRLQVTAAIVDGNKRRTTIGQVSALIVALSGFALVGYGFACGHPGAAAVVGSVELAAIVAAFLGRRGTPGEPEEP